MAIEGLKKLVKDLNWELPFRSTFLRLRGVKRDVYCIMQTIRFTDTVGHWSRK